MNTKPISATTHGIIDYVYAAMLLTVPNILGLNKKAKFLYAIDALNVLSYSTSTNYALGVRKYIPFKVHKHLDIDNTKALLLATLYKPIRKEKKTLCFHLSMIAAASVVIALTNWNDK